MIPGLLVGAATVRILWVNIAKTLREKRKVLDAYQEEGKKAGLTEKQAYAKYKTDYRAKAREEYEQSQKQLEEWQSKFVQLAVVLAIGFIVFVVYNAVEGMISGL